MHSFYSNFKTNSGDPDQTPHVYLCPTKWTVKMVRSDLLFTPGVANTKLVHKLYISNFRSIIADFRFYMPIFISTCHIFH